MMPPHGSLADYTEGDKGSDLLLEAGRKVGKRKAGKRSSKNVIRTTPDVWQRDGQPAPEPKPYEIVFRFPDRKPVRVRSFPTRTDAERLVPKLIGKIIVGKDVTVSLRDATSFAFVPDGQGPEGAEELDLSKS